MPYLLKESFQAQGYMQLESGILSESVFSDIADAIRGQDGLSTQYQPDDMAAAILALEWDVGYKVRALFLSGGALEFNYYDRRRTGHGGTIQQVFEVDTNGYASASARSWNSNTGYAYMRIDRAGQAGYLTAA